MPQTLELVLLARQNIQHSTDEQRNTLTRHLSSGSDRAAENVWRRAAKRLGAGGMGEVFREECISGPDRSAVRAVKIIEKPTALAGKIHWTRELEAVARFSQPQYERWFVRSLGWYDDSETVSIVMEFAQYGDLQHCLAKPLPEDDTRVILKQVLTGLSFMHELGYTHRDLKPQNILVFQTAPAWHVKIADFGLSKRAVASSTALRSIAGTPGFVAPEVLGFVDDNESDDEGSDDDALTTHTNAVDIWAIGVITFLLLTGQLPFPSQMEDGRVLNRYVKGRKKFPAAVLNEKNVSTDCRTMIQNAMAPAARDRPTAAASLECSWLRPPLAPQPDPAAVKHPSVIVSEASASWDFQDSFFSQTQVPAPLAGLQEVRLGADYESTQKSTLQSSRDEQRPSLVASSSSRDSDSATFSCSAPSHDGNSEGQSMSSSETIDASFLSETGVRPGTGKHVLQEYLIHIPPDDAKYLRYRYRSERWEFSPELKHIYLPELRGVRDGKIGPHPVLALEVVTGQSIRLGHGLSLKDVKWPAISCLQDGRIMILGRPRSEPHWPVSIYDSFTGGKLIDLNDDSKIWWEKPNFLDLVRTSPDGKIMVAIFDQHENSKIFGDASQVALYEVATGRMLDVLTVHPNTRVAFSLDSKRLAITYQTREKEELEPGTHWRSLIWDVATAGVFRKLEGSGSEHCPEHGDCISSTALSGNGRFLAIVSNGYLEGRWEKEKAKSLLHVVDVNLGQEHWTIQLQSSEMSFVTFSPNNRYIAAGGQRSSVRVWDVATGQELGSPCPEGLGRVVALNFSPEGKLVTACKDDCAEGYTIRIQYWEAHA